MTAVIKINHLISTQVSPFKCNFEKKKTPTFKTGYPFQLHFVLCLTLLYLYTIKKNLIHVYMLYTGYKPFPVITKISLDQSFTVLVVKHNIQVSTKWFPESKIWNFINNYISTKDTGFNLPSMHFKISFKTHSIHHNLKNNFILSCALSTKTSFCLSLTGLDIWNTSLSHHHHCVKTPYEIQTQFFTLVFPTWKLQNG